MASNSITGDSLVSKVGTKEQQDKYAEGFDRIFGKKKKPAEWDENRIDTIGQNGNDGLHYDEDPETIPTPPPPAPEQSSLGTNINEYDSPSKTIEQEVDELNNKPLNSLDRLSSKYPAPSD
jgi:hypothetical protein